MAKPATSRRAETAKVSGFVKQLLCSYALRMLCLAAFVLAVPIALDRYYQDSILPKEAVRFVREISGKKNPKADWNRFDFLDEARKKGCVWLFFANPAGRMDKDNPMPPPAIKKFYPLSRTYTYNGERFFDAASSTQYGTFHAGFRSDYLVQRLFAPGSTSLPIFLAVFLAFAAAAAGSYFWLTLPLRKVSYKLRALMLGYRAGNLDLAVTGIEYEIAELKELCAAIKELLLDNRRLLRISNIEQKIQEGTSDRIPTLQVKKIDGRRTSDRALNSTHGDQEVNTEARFLDPLTGSWAARPQNKSAGRGN